MNRCVCVLCGLLLLAIPASSVRADLAGDINTVLSDPLLAKAKIGIQIVRLGKSEDDIALIAQANPTAALTPASNLKVVTTSAILDKLGTDFSFRTQLLAHNGDLILVGDGDPTFGDAELLKKSGWDVDTVFKAWTAGLVKRHITTARNLLVDDSVFDDQFFHPNWHADQADKRYMAEISGMNLNANCIDFYVQPKAVGELVGFTTDPAAAFLSIKNTCLSGDDNTVWFSRQPGTNDLTIHGKARNANAVPISMTIHDPPMFAGNVLSEVLKNGGVTLTGSVVRDRTARTSFARATAAGDKSWTVLAVHETPLIDVITRANKDSMNLYAECMCKRLGFAVSGAGSWDAGTSAVKDFLTSLRIPADQFTLDDGCGLSSRNAISPNLMVKVLTHDFFGKNNKVWMGTLSVAGEDGTLLERFHGTDLRGRVIAKTGFIEGVSCLSGYLHAKDDNWYCFSIMFNGIPKESNSAVKVLQERIVRAVDLHTRPAVAAGE